MSKTVQRRTYVELYEELQEKESQNNRRVFEEWKKYQIDHIQECAFSFDELQTFKQCWDNDIDGKYCAVRKQLPSNWFISSRGNLITVNDGKVELVKPHVSGSAKTNTRREQYPIRAKYNERHHMPWDGYMADPGLIVLLVFDGKSTELARQLLNVFGMEALKGQTRSELRRMIKKANCSDEIKRAAYDQIPQEKTKKRKKQMKSNRLVEFHHEKHYSYFECESEREEKRARNCDIENTCLLTYSEHKNLSSQNKSSAKNILKIHGTAEAKNVSTIYQLGSHSDGRVSNSEYVGKGGLADVYRVIEDLGYKNPVIKSVTIENQFLSNVIFAALVRTLARKYPEKTITGREIEVEDVLIEESSDDYDSRPNYIVIFHWLSGKSGKEKIMLDKDEVTLMEERVRLVMDMSHNL